MHNSPLAREQQGRGGTVPDPQNKAVPRRYARAVFGLGFALALTDFIDRQIIVATFPLLKQHWGLSDARLGTLVSIVSVTVGLAALPAALLADRWDRAKSIAVMGVVWSLAALGCAVSGSYAQLAVARAAMGAGEAGYGPAGGALVTGMFPRQRWATVASALQSAGPIGAVLGAVLGGAMVDRLGWRVTLAVFAVPGLLFALLFLRVRDRRRSGLQPGASALTVVPEQRRSQPMGVRDTLAELFRTRTARAAYLGGAMQLVVLSTLYSWLSSYFTRTYGYSSTKAGSLSALAIIASAVGTVVLGYLADRFGVRRATYRLLLPAALAVIAMLLLTTAFAWTPHGHVQIALIIAGSFTVASAIGPVPAVVLDVVDPTVHASALGMVTLVQNLFGLAVGPLLTGWLSDAYGLSTALSLMPLFCVGGAIVLCYAARTYERDRNSTTA